MANSIVMKMRIFNNHQNTNLMAVLVKGQPFLIDKLTTPPHPKQADQQSLADQQSPPAGTPTTEGDLQAGPTIPLQPQKGN